MADKPITLTLSFHTADQAHHVLNAYHEAMGFDSTTGVSISHGEPGEIPTYQPPVVEDDEDEEELDERGVPYHPDYHSSTKKISKGAWNRRKGHDRVAADAYEARYLQAKSPHVGNGAAHVSNVASGGAPSMHAPSGNVPSSEAFQALWVDLCQKNRVTMPDQQHIEKTWGGHPMSGVFMDPSLRAQAYAYLLTK